MHKKRFIVILFALAIITSMILSACAQAAPATLATTQVAETPPVKVRMAILPILDNLPIYVAQQEGLFEKHNVIVELIPVGSAAERDQVIVAGQADGMINETISTLLYNKEQPQVQIVRFARTATSTASQYSILASANSGIESVKDLSGVEIGISQGTIIEYITNRLLEAEGLPADEIKTIAVPKIADRMALLASGELKAATLPDPLSTLAIQQGAKVVIDDTKHPEYGYSTYAFLISFIEKNPNAVRNFLTAIDEAINMINADPAKWTNLLSEQKLVPEPLLESYKVPPFPQASVPSEAQWQDALVWAKEKGLVSRDVSYSASINPSFLP